MAKKRRKNKDKNHDKKSVDTDRDKHGDLIAQNIDHTPFESGEVARDVAEAMAETAGAVAGAIVDKVSHPYRGEEDKRLAECTKGDRNAWTKAYEAHRQLKKYLTREESERLSKAIIRNELHHYDLGDTIGDMTKHGTIGYAQIKPEGLPDLENRNPKLKEFLKEKGYAGKDHEARALQDPTCLPMIVASKLNNLCDYYEKNPDVIKEHYEKDKKSRVEPTIEHLAYAYNADVYYNPKDKEPRFHCNTSVFAALEERAKGNEKAFPTSNAAAMKASKHLEHMQEQLRIIERKMEKTKHRYYKNDPSLKYERDERYQKLERERDREQKELEKAKKRERDRGRNRER